MLTMFGTKLQILIWLSNTLASMPPVLYPVSYDEVVYFKSLLQVKILISSLFFCVLSWLTKKFHCLSSDIYLNHLWEKSLHLQLLKKIKCLKRIEYKGFFIENLVLKRFNIWYGWIIILNLTRVWTGTNGLKYQFIPTCPKSQSGAFQLSSDLQTSGWLVWGWDLIGEMDWT